MSETRIKLFHSIPDVAFALDLSVSKIYQLIRAGKLEAKALDGRTGVTDESLHRYSDSLPPAPIGQNAQYRQPQIETAARERTGGGRVGGNIWVKIKYRLICRVASPDRNHGNTKVVAMRTTRRPFRPNYPKKPEPARTPRRGRIATVARLVERLTREHGFPPGNAEIARLLACRIEIVERARAYLDSLS